MLAETEYLEGFWREGWREVGAVTNPLPPFYRIINGYERSGRFYHRASHLYRIFKDLAEYPGLIESRGTLYLSIFGHDFKYRPEDRQYDDEVESAMAMHEILEGARVESDPISRVDRMILLTKHREIPEDSDSRLLLDLDLGVFGYTAEEFDAYEVGIRKEYEMVGWDTFKKVRAGILEGFSRRDPIYLTEHFHQKYEAQARINLSRSIKNLRS